MEKSFFQDCWFPVAENPTDWQSQSGVSTVPTSEVTETPESGVSVPPGLEYHIPVPPGFEDEIPVCSKSVEPKADVAGASLVVEESPKSMPPGLEETSQASFQSLQMLQELPWWSKSHQRACHLDLKRRPKQVSRVSKGFRRHLRLHQCQRRSRTRSHRIQLLTLHR